MMSKRTLALIGIAAVLFLLCSVFCGAAAADNLRAAEPGNDPSHPAVIYSEPDGKYLRVQERLPTGYAEPAYGSENSSLSADLRVSGTGESGTSGGIVWSLKDGVLTISPNPAAEPGKCGVMPDYAEPYDVPWYQYRESTSSVGIEDGVKNIGQNAFYTGYFTDITIPGSVTSIGDYAFYYCDLTTVTIPDGVETIGEGAFEYCYDLTSLSIDKENSRLKSIGKSAFYDCESLSGMTIPDSVETIGDGAFLGCEKLPEVTIPKSVTSIGDFAFSYCYLLAEIRVNPENTAYTAVDGVLFTKDEAYLICYPAAHAGDSYSVPDTVKEIAGGAFAGSRFLTQVIIPEQVTIIGHYVFADCRELKEILVDSGNTAYATADGVLFTNDKTSLICYPAARTGDSYCVPDTVKEICDYAFYYAHLTGVTIPDSVETIGYGAFEWCDSLTCVSFAEKSPLKVIDDYVFHSCTRLTRITIPDGVETIDYGAFADCSSLACVTIKENSRLKTIGEFAFYECTSLTEIAIPDGVETIDNSAFSHCNYLACVTIKENSRLKTISNWAFTECTSLTGITIPDGVETIGYGAFSRCSSLACVTIKENSRLKAIDDYVFYECGSLSGITIPDRVETIGEGAFCRCPSLRWVVLLNSSVSPGSDAFSGIGQGSIIYFAGDSAEPLDGCYSDSKTAVALMGDAVPSGEISNPPKLTKLQKKGYTFEGWVNAKGESVSAISVPLNPADSPYRAEFVKKKASGSQGTSVWLTAAPTQAPTPTPTVVPTQEVPTVKPVTTETPQAKTPAPVMGILAGLGAAAVLFGLRRK